MSSAERCTGYNKRDMTYLESDSAGEKMKDWLLRLDPKLFGDIGADIYDFEETNWKFFLDNVGSLEDLLKGLHQLTPWVDDALGIAEHMNVQDFRKFKKALAKERLGEKRMPRKYHALIIPEKFILGSILAEKFEVSLGTAMVQLTEPQVLDQWL